MKQFLKTVHISSNQSLVIY